MLPGACVAKTTQSTKKTDEPIFRDLANELLAGFGNPFYVFDMDSESVFFDESQLPPPPPFGLLTARITPTSGNVPVAVHSTRPMLALYLEVSVKHRGKVAAVGFFSATRLATRWIFRTILLRWGFSEKSANFLAENLSRQPPWSKEALRTTGQMFLRQWHWSQQAIQAGDECRSLAADLATRYEEISLLHRLAQSLRISQTDEELAHLALEWMEETVPAESLAFLLWDPEEHHSLHSLPNFTPGYFWRGKCLLDAHRLYELAQELKVWEASRPVVLNHCREKLSEKFSHLQHLIIAPLRGGNEYFGILGAFNHREGKEFGTIEASLLASVAAILGSHSANLLLYRRQEESLSGILRALTSAIDAKDAYTCGHSDRVARVAVRLAQELGLEGQTLHTIYLAGLLHDIGKIGTSEAILCKPGKLTPEEYEHIKNHVRIGYRILMDLKHLSGVLPAVLHHHEHWDGSGYPAGLAGEEIPLSARIIAVADAFDAMGSDRPYRPRLSDEKISTILREGAGKQWDPQVVEVFFRIRDEIESIVLEDRSYRVSHSAFPLAKEVVSGAVPAAVLSPV